MIEMLFKPYLFVLALTPVCLVLLTVFLRTRRRNPARTHAALTALCTAIVLLTFPLGDGHIFNLLLPVIGIFAVPLYWLRDAAVYLPAVLFIWLSGAGKDKWSKSLLLLPLLAQMLVYVVQLCAAGAYLSFAFHLGYLVVVALFFAWGCAHHNRALAWAAAALFVLVTLAATAVQAAALLFPAVEEMMQAVVDNKLSYSLILGLSVFDPMRQVGCLTFFPLLTHMSAVALSGIHTKKEVGP